MYKIDLYKEEIICRYLAGETALDISKTIPLHNSTISRALHKWGVSRGQKSKKRIDNEQDIIADYLSGNYYCEDLAAKYDLDVHTIYDILNEAKVKRHSGIRSNCKEDYFEQIDSPNKAYLLGFITADGAIVNDCVSIEVKSSDAGIIEFARAEINPFATVTNIGYTSYSTCQTTGKKYKMTKDDKKVAFSAKALGRSLQKYGVVQNKSKTIQRVPIELIPKELLPFYFRGLIDGDGCVHKDGKVSIYSGSEPFIKSVQDILVKEVGVSKLGIYHGTTFFVTWASKKDKQKLFDYLYKNLKATYFYPRKYERLKNNLESC